MIRNIAKHLFGLIYSIRKHRKINFRLCLKPGSIFVRGKKASIRSLQLCGKLRVGDGTTILEGAKFNGVVSIGCHSRIGKNFSCHGEVTVGNYCAIAQDCFLISENHRMDLPAMQVAFQRDLFPDLRLSTNRQVNLGHNVWLGKSVIILPGVTVGNGAVIGAGSVVTKDVRPYSIVAGNPAKFIKFRFSPDISRKIEASNWFMLPPVELVKHKEFFSAEDFDSFTEGHSNHIV